MKTTGGKPQIEIIINDKLDFNLKSYLNKFEASILTYTLFFSPSHFLQAVA